MFLNGITASTGNFRCCCPPGTTFGRVLRKISCRYSQYIGDVLPLRICLGIKVAHGILKILSRRSSSRRLIRSPCACTKAWGEISSKVITRGTGNGPFPLNPSYLSVFLPTQLRFHISMYLSDYFCLFADTCVYWNYIGWVSWLMGWKMTVLKR